MKGVKRAELFLRWPEGKLKESNCLLLKGRGLNVQKKNFENEQANLSLPQRSYYVIHLLCFSNISFSSVLELIGIPLCLKTRQNYGASRACLLVQRSSNIL